MEVKPNDESAPATVIIRNATGVFESRDGVEKINGSEVKNAAERKDFFDKLYSNRGGRRSISAELAAIANQFPDGARRTDGGANGGSK